MVYELYINKEELYKEKNESLQRLAECLGQVNAHKI